MRMTNITHMYSHSYLSPIKISINPASEKSFVSGQPNFQKRCCPHTLAGAFFGKKAWKKFGSGECVSVICVLVCV